MTTLLEEGAKRFQEILEFTESKTKYPKGNLLEFTTFTKDKLVDEADDESQMDDQQGGGLPEPPAVGDTMQPDVGQDMSQNGGDVPPVDDESMGDPMSQGGAQTPEGLNPQDDGDVDISDEGFADDGVGPDDEVIDITDLTDAQETTDKKVDKLGAYIKKTLKHLNDFENMIQSNNSKIEDLQREFEKRNPSQEEKLSMRAATSYPFNVTPKEYWDNKEKNSNYSLDDDNNGEGQGQYTITNKDLASTDWKSISNSMDDRLLHQSIKNTLML